VAALQHLRAADYRVMPWKNGLGSTTQIAVHPPEAGLDAFTWRLSVAELLASGPFSTFPGYDRVLVQLDGAPMTLTHEGGGEERLRLLTPYRFAGELGTHGQLDPPPARDFNLMVRRDRARGDLAVREMASGSSVAVREEAATCVVYVLRGAVSVEDTVLGPDETLIATDAGKLLVTALEDAVVFVIALRDLVEGR
jgi:uncharacterized protein